MYTAAGFFFERVKPARVLLFALPGIYFAFLTSGGFIFARWLGEPAITLPLTTFFRLVFIALHLMALAAAVLSGKFTPPEDESPGEPESVTEEDFLNGSEPHMDFDTEKEGA
jgi:hypothetical protein